MGVGMGRDVVGMGGGVGCCGSALQAGIVTHASCINLLIPHHMQELAGAAHGPEGGRH